MKFTLLPAFILFLYICNRIYKRQLTIERKNKDDVDSKDHDTPDIPLGFGYKCVWIAVKTNDKNKVAQILQLKNIAESNWQNGIDKAYKNSVFITPCIDGWTLAVGWGLPSGDSPESIEEIKHILQMLSIDFGEAQFFGTHRVVEFHCWIKATNGIITRVYSYLGESGENLAVEGTPTEFEQTLNLINTFSDAAKDEKYFEDENFERPDEELVMKVAKHWSLDPSKIDEREDLSPSVGIVGIR